MHLGHYQLVAAVALSPSIGVSAFIALMACAAATFLVDAIKTYPGK